MASYNKFEAFVEHLAEEVHNFASDAISIYLSNATPSAAGDVTKSDLAEISTGAGYSGPVALSNKVSGQAGGTYEFAADDVTITASGGPVGPFRYVVLFNDTPTSPADPLIGWWDYGSELTLADGESLLVDFSAGDGIFQIV